MRRVGRWIGILQKCFQIRNQEVEFDLSICGDFSFCEISFLNIFRGFVWESGQLQALRVGHWIEILQKFFQIRDQEVEIDLSVCSNF